LERVTVLNGPVHVLNLVPLGIRARRRSHGGHGPWSNAGLAYVEPGQRGSGEGGDEEEHGVRHRVAGGTIWQWRAVRPPLL
jgi:hypothetical protein